MPTHTDLERRLADDPRGHTRAAMIDTLDAAVAQLSRLQRQPLPAAEYARAERLRASCQAAIHVIEHLWQRQHGRPGQ